MLGELRLFRRRRSRAAGPAPPPPTSILQLLPRRTGHSGHPMGRSSKIADPPRAGRAERGGKGDRRAAEFRETRDRGWAGRTPDRRSWSCGASDIRTKRTLREPQLQDRGAGRGRGRSGPRRGRGRSGPRQGRVGAGAGWGRWSRTGGWGGDGHRDGVGVPVGFSERWGDLGRPVLPSHDPLHIAEVVASPWLDAATSASWRRPLRPSGGGRETGRVPAATAHDKAGVGPAERVSTAGRSESAKQPGTGLTAAVRPSQSTRNGGPSSPARAPEQG